MNVTVDIANDSDCEWTPGEQDCLKWIQCALQSLDMERDMTVSLRFVDEAESEKLNTRFRGKQSATNVLSFPAQLPEEISRQLEHEPLGDIVICPNVVEKEAGEQGKELAAHWAHLLIHGVLHLLGYDHEDDKSAQEMEQLETKILEILGFPDPYLIG